MKENKGESETKQTSHDQEQIKSFNIPKGVEFDMLLIWRDSQSQSHKRAKIINKSKLYSTSNIITMIIETHVFTQRRSLADVAEPERSTDHALVR